MNLFKLKSGELYEIAKKSYSIVYNNIMSRGKQKQVPTQLASSIHIVEKDNFSDFIQDNYLVSAKPSNSIEFLLLIGEVDENSEGKSRFIFFIDRDMNYWTIEDLPLISGCSQMLFDGNLIFTSQIIATSDVINLKDGSFVYYATDLLYGPSNPTFEDESARLKLNIGASFAMIGPKANMRWPFYKRYDILQKIVQSEYSPIYIYCKQLPIKFKISSSPFFPVKEVFYKYNKASKVQNFIKDTALRVSVGTISLHRLDVDLIFKNSDGRYETLVWNQNQTIYIQCVLKNGVLKAGLLNGNKNNIVFVDIPLTGVTTTLSIKDGDILICSVDSNSIIVRNHAPYIQHPDSIEKLNAILREQHDPIDLDLISSALNPSQLNARMKTRILGQMSETFKYRCLMSKPENVLKILDEQTLYSLQKLIDEYRKPGQLKCTIELSSGETLSLQKLFKGHPPNISESLEIYSNGYCNIYGILGPHRLPGNIIPMTDPVLKLDIPISKTMQVCKYNIRSIVTYVMERVATKKSIIYRYQKKYELNGMPEHHSPNILWKFEYTIYGESNGSEEDAKKKYTENPKTLIELKFSPGEQETNAWAYYNTYPSEQTLQQIVKSFSLPLCKSKEEVEIKLFERISKLKNLPTNVIIQDFCRTLHWILSA